MRDQRPYGKHELYVEEDTLSSVLHGEIRLAEVQDFCRAAEEVIAKYGYCLILGDLTDSRGMEAEARRRSAHWSIGKPVLGTAMVNENLIARTVFTLLLKAGNLLRGQSTPFAYFSTEQEARDWLAQLRKQHLANKAQGLASPASSGESKSRAR